MGVFSKPIVYVGKEFKNEQEALVYFQSKIKLTKEDLDEMGSRLQYWLDERQKKGFPACGLYSTFTGDENRGYYIGYPVFDKNPEKMQQKILKATESWKTMFKDKPEVIQSILYT